MPIKIEKSAKSIESNTRDYHNRKRQKNFCCSDSTCKWLLYFPTEHVGESLEGKTSLAKAFGFCVLSDYVCKRSIGSI